MTAQVRITLPSAATGLKSRHRQWESPSWWGDHLATAAVTGGTGLGAAHCSSCHQTFTGVGAFEMHRSGSHAGGARHCLDPATVRSEKTGEPLLVPADKPWAGWSRPGTWRGLEE